MNSQNVPLTVKLGHGANIRLGNAEINTGATGATIRFGTIEVPIPGPTATPAAFDARGIYIGRNVSKGPNPVEKSARRAHLPVQQSKPVEATCEEVPRQRASVFERLGYREAPAFKKTLTKTKVSMKPVYPVSLQTESYAPGKNDAEASSSGSKLSRKQKRKLNAKLRAEHLLPEQQVAQVYSEPVVTVPTHSKFTNLKWVKRNSSTVELKKSFWAQQRQAPVPQPKMAETLYARVHRVLKTVKEKVLIKRRTQRPFTTKADDIPTKKVASIMVAKHHYGRVPYSDRRGVMNGLQVQKSAIRHPQQKEKHVWRPKPQK